MGRFAPPPRASSVKISERSEAATCSPYSGTFTVHAAVVPSACGYRVTKRRLEGRANSVRAGAFLGSSNE
ncbi:hypothetical protein HNQ39_003372 [Armatimonas rosea]|uniref:Uncharacterized protein n=1 Tax=Armatimonas rosea TaxID=685828 RepID=A0A7W9SRP1_ARMRO|nr:hypothetical protein [Armatimonas rosea]